MSEVISRIHTLLTGARKVFAVVETNLPSRQAARQHQLVQ